MDINAVSRFYIFLLIILLNSCSFDKRLLTDQPDPTEYKWGTNKRIIIENGYYHSYRHLDTLTHQLKGDTLIPLEFTENNKVVLTRLLSSQMDMRETEGGITEFVTTEATFRKDTFIFDMQKQAGKSFLILYSDNAASLVYELKDENTEISETNNLKQPVYRIKGYTVGETIDREAIDIVFTDNFGQSVVEEARLTADPAILFIIVGRKHIEQIQQFDISNGALESIKKELNKLFTRKAEYEEIINGEGPDRQIMQGYFWNEKEVSISLQRTIPDGGVRAEPDWTLTYNNYIITNILQNYLEMPPENL